MGDVAAEDGAVELGEAEEPETELAVGEESADDTEDGKNVALVERTRPTPTGSSALSSTKNDVGNAFAGGNDLGPLVAASLDRRSGCLVC